MTVQSNLSARDRAAFYKSHREHEGTTFKKKHRRQFDHEFRDLTGADPAMSVLEIGCGTGLLLRYLEACGYARIAGLDRDENLLDTLSDLNRSEIHIGDAATVLNEKFAGQRFDRIVMFDVAEHIDLPDLIELLKALRGFLSDDGKLLLRVPNIESPWGLKMFFGTFDHVTPLGPGRLRELARLTGWKCVSVSPQEPVPTLRRWRERLLNRLLAAMLSYHPEAWTANVLAVYVKD
ncbi:MAG: class I SAM-dependent methyltransferase [Rhodospirillales bacterium]|nr:class I SAM-dependent methyltransferase [Rhodospirillales bacterium]